MSKPHSRRPSALHVGFFTVLRRDPIHLLHAQHLVESTRAVMPDIDIVQFTDETTPAVDGVSVVRRLPHGPLLERRLEHYAACTGSWLFVDTDVHILRDVRDALTRTDPAKIAVADRHWPGIPQGDDVMHTMPFNTGVVFSRSSAFWAAVLDTWRRFPPDTRNSWLSEQLAFYHVVRTGAFRVKILPGQVYNYPPRRADDPLTDVAIAHFKGPRKVWLTERIEKQWEAAAPQQVPACESV